MRWILERLVGSTKPALKKTLGTACYWVDKLTTILTEVEAVLNSPSHHTHVRRARRTGAIVSFLLSYRKTVDCSSPVEKLRDEWYSWRTSSQILDSSAGNIERILGKVEQRVPNRITRCQQHQRSFSKFNYGRWHRTPTWDDATPTVMEMGRVEKTFPGRDGKIRSCILKLPGGTTARRPVQLIYPLEVTWEINIVLLRGVRCKKKDRKRQFDYKPTGEENEGTFLACSLLLPEGQCQFHDLQFCFSFQLCKYCLDLCYKHSLFAIIDGFIIPELAQQYDLYRIRFTSGAT